MVLTYNYGDLQNIKAKMGHINMNSTKEKYLFIAAYKETLEFMLDNNLAHSHSKAELEDELNNLVEKLLGHKNISYKELEQKYGQAVTTSYISPNKTSLKL